MTPEEFKEKKQFSIGFVVWAVALAFTLGGTVTTLLGLKEYMLAEIDGLRADVERADAQLGHDIDRVNTRIDRKVSNHEMIYHKDEK